MLLKKGFLVETPSWQDKAFPEQLLLIQAVRARRLIGDLEPVSQQIDLFSQEEEFLEPVKTTKRKPAKAKELDTSKLSIAQKRAILAQMLAKEI